MYDRQKLLSRHNDLLIYVISSNRIVLINPDLCCNIVANSKVSDLADEFRVLVLALVECLFVLGRFYVWFWNLVHLSVGMW